MGQTIIIKKLKEKMAKATRIRFIRKKTAKRIRTIQWTESKE